MYRLTCLLLIGLIVASIGMPFVHAQNERLVLAFYYAWYDQATWASGQVSDQPVQPYDSRDRATIERHVSQAKSAGIDALVQSWYGPSGGANNMTESNFATLLDVSAEQGLRAAVDLEVTGPFFGSAGDVQGALATLLARHARHPAYLKAGGRPVIFFWRQQRFSVDTWAAIRQQVDPDRASIWIAEGVDLAYLRVFDGIHLYSVAWSADPTSVLVNFGSRVRQAAQDLGEFRYWVATAMPGYDDTRLRGAGGFVRPRADGEYYRATFAGASKSGADWLIVTSFNEWLEGSQIEPGVSYGETYLDLTRELAAAYRAGAAMPSATAPAASAATLPSSTPASAIAARAKVASTPTASPTSLPTSTTMPSPSPTFAAAPTFTPMPSATASATSLPTDTPTPEALSSRTLSLLDSMTTPAWVAVGGIALLSGVLLGVVWSKSHRAGRLRNSDSKPGL